MSDTWNVRSLICQKSICISDTWNARRTDTWNFLRCLHSNVRSLKVCQTQMTETDGWEGRYKCNGEVCQTHGMLEVWSMSDICDSFKLHKHPSPPSDHGMFEVPPVPQTHSLLMVLAPETPWNVTPEIFQQMQASISRFLKCYFTICQRSWSNSNIIKRLKTGEKS